MLVEEFKRCINSDVKSFLDEKEVETLKKAARLADEDSLTHKVSFVSKANPSKPFYPPSGHKPSPSLQSGKSNQNAPKSNPRCENIGHNLLSQPICNYCKQSGHIVTDCPGFVNVPLHDIYLSSDLVNGPVAVGIRQTLPFKGVHLLLGNDLAGDKFVVNPLVTDTPCIDLSPDPIQQELPDLNPSCAVTRAMAKKAMLTESQMLT